MTYSYNASRAALLTPARNAKFFAHGRPATEAALCAELSRLVYAPFEREPAARAMVVATLQRVGLVNCEFFDAQGTQALLAHDPLAGLGVLVFRGTEVNLQDWVTDLDARQIPWPQGGRVHAGFAAALDDLWPAIETALTRFTGRALFTGHSLGAALATLAASRHAPQALYTYGSPRVGDADFVQSLSGLGHQRFIDCCDLVCRVPPQVLGYQHAGTVAYIDRCGRVHVNPDEVLIAADQRRARWGYQWRRAWVWGNLWLRDLADHAPVNYVSALNAAH